MAITEDMGFPRLTPPDDRMPSGRRLFRSPEELTDDQFDLLAAAWAEDALAGDALTEVESAIAARADRRSRAESFRRIRLVPGNESWPGMHESLRRSPARIALRRSIIPAMLAVAAMLVLVLYGPAGAKLKTLNNPARINGTTAMTVAEIPGALPIIRTESPVSSRDAAVTAVATRNSGSLIDNILAENQIIAASQVIPSDQVIAREMPETNVERAMPLPAMHDGAAILAIAPATDRNLSTIIPAEVNPSTILREEKNWMLRSISFLASAVTGKEKEINGYMIANGCINGINTILGWEMELEQVSNKAGDPVAVSFSSALLSFSKPLNKTAP